MTSPTLQSSSSLIICLRCNGQMLIETDSTLIKDSAGPGKELVLVCVQCGDRKKIK